MGRKKHRVTRRVKLMISVMPALWQSSQRPMYIRTVWVDGFRHAILTHDDPHFLKLCARRRPLSSTSYINHSPKHDKIDDLRKLHFVIKSHKLSDTDQRHTENIEKLNLSIESSDDENGDDVCIDEVDNKIDWEKMRATKTTRTARNDVKEDTELSDRVLQWLDLAGKIDLLAPNNTEIAQPRHSWPEIQRRNLVKSKTATELRSKEIKPESKPNIDRPEVYLPLANTIENYAKQSRNVKITQRHEVKRDNRKVNVKMNIIEARQKIATEKNAIEKQYSDLMSKKQIDVGKRRQVHIFMPAAMPKKGGSNTTSRTESLISSMAQ